MIVSGHHTYVTYHRQHIMARVYCDVIIVTCYVFHMTPLLSPLATLCDVMKAQSSFLALSHEIPLKHQIFGIKTFNMWYNIFSSRLACEVLKLDPSVMTSGSNLNIPQQVVMKTYSMHHHAWHYDNYCGLSSTEGYGRVCVPPRYAL